MLGKVLKNRRAGETKLAWNAGNLQGPDILALTSPDFPQEGTIPTMHAAKRVGGQDISPALDWSGVPEQTRQLLLVIEDTDAPTSAPFVHGVALLDAGLTGILQGALNARQPAPGVTILRSGMGRGYLGPAPIKGHGPHRYVFELFALAAPLTAGSGGTSLDDAKPRDIIAAASDVLARGRLDGFYERS